MISIENVARFHGEPSGEYIKRAHRQIRLKQMLEVKIYLLNIKASEIPYDKNLCEVLEILAGIVEDIIEEGFV